MLSAGADLQWMKWDSEASVEWNLKDACHAATMLQRVGTCQKPTIAQVNGVALDGGVGLTYACDIAVASESASFVLSETKFCILTAAIGSYVVSAIGRHYRARACARCQRRAADRRRGQISCTACADVTRCARCASVSAGHRRHSGACVMRQPTSPATVATRCCAPCIPLLGEHRDGIFSEVVGILARNVFPLPGGGWVDVEVAPMGVNHLTARWMLFPQAGLRYLLASRFNLLKV